MKINKSKKNSKSFWDKEYKNSKYLALSDEASSDLVKFTRWAERNSEWYPFPKIGKVLDVGCGNGRNVLYMAENFKMHGYGFDISEVAINQGRKMAMEKKLPVKLEVQSARDPIPLGDQTVDVVLDMMASHFLNNDERQKYMAEIRRVIKPYGWLFFKSFILDDDAHARRLLRDNPSDEQGTYIHPHIGVAEHVWTEEEVRNYLGPYFKIHKFMMSHKHIMDGKPWKRRTFSVYAERMRDE